jgi:hypothetical protein
MLRIWLGKVKNNMTKERRALFKETAKQVVVKRRRANGTVSVSGTQSRKTGEGSGERGERRGGSGRGESGKGRIGEGRGERSSDNIPESQHPNSKL